MKEKKLLNMLLVAMFALFSVGIVSCSDTSDDDDEAKINSPVVGTWVISYSSFKATLVFTSSGNVSLESVIDGVRKKSTGTYEVSSGNDCIVKIYWSDTNTPEMLEVLVTGNTMKTKGLGSKSELTWTKQ